jgi:hypothetical protein
MRALRNESSLVPTGKIYRAVVVVLLFGTLAAQGIAQSPETRAAAPTNQPSGAATSSPPVATADKEAAATPPPKPAASAKPKKVITNEDLERRSDNAARKALDGDSGSWLNCEASCEQQAREEAGYNTDRDAEWQMQIINARRELAADLAWRQMLMEAIQQSNTYCNFLSQQSQKVSPSGNGYQARVQRTKTDQYFQTMDSVLKQKLQTLANQMTQHTNEVGALSPVRGAMMYVQGTRILQRTCQFPPPQ